ncbi:MAG: terminase, partial [Muribaculaceae bacterium]|nr:terminase [Muribaculaceae bacterium]
MSLIEEILKEDSRRRKALSAPYNPVSGAISPGNRFAITIPELDQSRIHIPAAMKETPEVKSLLAGRALTEVFPGSLENARQRWFQLRCRFDFPFWAYKCIRIKHKDGGSLDIPFLLNAPQRKLIGEFEKMREADMPIRIVLLKARQWGGSTATQMYMLWIQLMRRKGFNSLIVGHQHSSTEEVIDMAKTALNHYPRTLLTDDGTL